MDGDIIKPFSAPDRSLVFALLLIIAAGFLDAFTYVGHGGVFANAMTGNVVLLAIAAVRHLIFHENSVSYFIYLWPICFYIFGVSVAHIITKSRIKEFIGFPARISLLMEIVFLIIVAAAENKFSSIPDSWVVCGIAFVAALQGTSFKKIEEFTYTSVTTSGNLRTAVESIIDAIFGYKNRHHREILRKGLAFGAICVGFIAGAALGARMTIEYHDSALLVPILLLSLAFLMFLPWNELGAHN